MRRLILASASPRRRELLSLLGLPFDVIVSDVDEGVEGTPNAIARELAARKAEAVATTVHGEPCVIIGADTIVALDVSLTSSMGKPTDADEAREMLRALSGRPHTVFTGVAVAEVLDRDPPGRISTSVRVVETTVKFRLLSGEMIDAYVATGEPFDKAGAYGIQGYASAFVEAIDGDYFNVVGLPVSTVAAMLEEIGIAWWRGSAALSDPGSKRLKP